MKWITREHPKIDRIACPWLIRRFIDPDAEFLYVPYDQVLDKAAETGAIPFDIPGVEITHYGNECSFDYLIKKYKITDAGVNHIAPIVRGADTDHHELAAQAAGLWAISAGMAYNYRDDHELLEQGMLIYDALYSWATHLKHDKHTQHPVEQLLLEVLQQYEKQKSDKTKTTPSWVRELKELLQDQIDTSITLKKLSKDLNINASYLSREFSRHFNNLSFGEYIRKLRIERAIELLNDPSYSLTDISFLTGFSDQSHFIRIFKKHTGISPSVYRKKMAEK